MLHFADVNLGRLLASSAAAMLADGACAFSIGGGLPRRGERGRILVRVLERVMAPRQLGTHPS